MNKSILKTNTSRRNFLGGTAATVALTAGVGTVSYTHLRAHET